MSQYCDENESFYCFDKKNEEKLLIFLEFKVLGESFHDKVLSGNIIFLRFCQLSDGIKVIVNFPFIMNELFFT